MPDNQTPSDFHLPDHSVLEISGRDASAFMQAQCMNDLSALADGQWQWNGWLTPQGRVIALFALLRRDAETLWCVLPDVDARDLAPKLQRYVFRSKVRLAPLDTCHVGSFEPPVIARGSTFALLDEGEVELDLSGEGGPRTLLIGCAPAYDNDAAVARWNESDLRHGLPRLAADAEPKWTPQQLSLDRLRAYSVKKGCYPGQEIVARTHFLGQAKRGLMLLGGTQAIADGARVSDGAHDIGTVISSNGNLVLAVASLDGAPATIDGNAVKSLPLLDGLAR